MPKKKSQSAKITSSKTKETIGTITKEDQLKMIRAARRADAIARGLNEAARGTGAWGGSKQQQQRRQRRSAKKDITERIIEVSDAEGI